MKYILQYFTIAIVLYIRFKTDSKLKDVKYLIISKKKKVRTKESPVIKHGDRKEGRPAYTVHSLSDENAFAIERRTELCLQVNLPSSRYDLQLDTTCCTASDRRQKEQLDD